MFDISDSSSLKEMNSLVLKDYNYSEALYNYKCVLADAEENLLGFALQSYGDEESAAYLLYCQYRNNHVLWQNTGILCEKKHKF